MYIYIYVYISISISTSVSISIPISTCECMYISIYTCDTHANFHAHVSLFYRCDICVRYFYMTRAARLSLRQGVSAAA